ncbi:MAG: ABC transporter ATP-binding protein [Actinomycetales bacterium]|nr:ABC transporter ATP-binding protein [Actinomycetales bacterium]
MTPTEPAIEVKALRKQYGALTAVEDISFDVAAGECVALLGPNGAGKTTTTEILEGYRQPDAGIVRVLGVDPWRAPRAWKARIGIVLQSDRDLGDLTVGEAIGHFARYYPDPLPVGEAIEAVGLTDKARSRNDRLSGGQRRRLDVALGIIGRPEVLFLDEPTTGFDPEARREFWSLIESLRDRGTTILLTTHYLEEAEHLADRVAVIARGRLLACASPADLGGRHDGQAEVGWLDGGRARSEWTERPTELVAALAERLGGEIPRLTIRRPSLEDTYLELIRGAETTDLDATPHEDAALAADRPQP